MPRGPAAVAIELSDEERVVLGRLARRRRSVAGLAQRCRIVLECARGDTNTAVAARLGVSVPTVRRWRGRYAERGVDGLLDEPRPGQPRKISDEKVEEVIVKTLEAEPPDGGTHWSTRRMATATGLNQTAISRIWRAFGLQPHRVEHWKLSKDPLFVEKVRDIVGLYLDPPERAVVLCVDELGGDLLVDLLQEPLELDRAVTVVQLADHVAGRGVQRGEQARGAVALVVVAHPLWRARQQRQDRRRAVKRLELDVHLILDNYSTHKTPAINKWLAAHPRFHLHFTPTSGSWLNLVERWFGELTARKLRRGVHRSVKELNADIDDWADRWNEDPQPYVWVKTADEILDNLARYSNTINASGH
jgi:transposase